MDFLALEIPLPFALALVALVGYLVSRARRGAAGQLVARSRRKLQRAQAVASGLEDVVESVRKGLAGHEASLVRFKERVDKLGERYPEADWSDLGQEAEEALKPTLRLAAQFASAYEEICQQSVNLRTFTASWTDSLTGVKNRRGLDDVLKAQFALKARYGTKFSLVIFDIDHFKQINDQEGHLHGDRALRELAKLIDETVRETDVVTRYGGDEFVVVMPQTDLDRACVLAERLRAGIEQQMSFTVSGGVAAAIDGDTQDSLLARADEALYTAKAAGRNCFYRHTLGGTRVGAKRAACGELKKPSTPPGQLEAIAATRTCWSKLEWPLEEGPVEVEQQDEVRTAD